ncbi:transposase [Mycobacterium riyadhense]|nr:transposase [Mycobacterium riyadhense]
MGGPRRRVWAFVMVLALSRLMFVRPVLSLDQRAWTQCHVGAFRFFGGVPKRLVPDNLGTGWSARTCMTRRSTVPAPNYVAITARWLIAPGPASQRQTAGGRPMPYVRDLFGGAGSGAR